MIRLRLRFAIVIAILTIGNVRSAEEPWVSAVPRDPIAKQIVERRCRTDAKEAIYSTVEGVSSIYVTVEGEHAFQDVFVNTNSSGLSYSTFWRNYGSYGVETDGLKFFDSAQNPERLPIALILDKPSFRKNRLSSITVSYRRESTSEEESVGVYGRTITIRDERSKRILGERTEFFWLSSGGFRNGSRAQKALCPYTRPMERSPVYFVEQVINPISSPCSRIYADKYNATAAWFSANSLPLLRPGSDPKAWTRHSDEYQKRKAADLEELYGCRKRAKELLPPRPK